MQAPEIQALGDILQALLGNAGKMSEAQKYNTQMQYEGAREERRLGVQERQIGIQEQQIKYEKDLRAGLGDILGSLGNDPLGDDLDFFGADEKGNILLNPSLYEAAQEPDIGDLYNELKDKNIPYFNTIFGQNIDTIGAITDANYKRRLSDVGQRAVGEMGEDFPDYDYEMFIELLKRNQLGSLAGAIPATAFPGVNTNIIKEGMGKFVGEGDVGDEGGIPQVGTGQNIAMPFENTWFGDRLQDVADFATEKGFSTNVGKNLDLMREQENPENYPFEGTEIGNFANRVWSSIFKKNQQTETSGGSLLDQKMNRLNEMAKETDTTKIPKIEIGAGKDSLAYKNNNPGNLKYVGQSGATEGQSGFAKFKTPEDGYNALRKQVNIYKTRFNNLTLAQMVGIYSPEFENDTERLIRDYSAMLGVSSDTPISKIDTEKLVEVIAFMESNTRIK